MAADLASKVQRARRCWHHAVQVGQPVSSVLSGTANEDQLPTDTLLDLLGDSNDQGHYSARHDDTNRAWYHAAAATATGAVVLCDKGKRFDEAARAQAKKRYAYLNKGHVPDHARPRQGKNGVDIILEVKVISPHDKHTPGAGNE